MKVGILLLLPLCFLLLSNSCSKSKSEDKLPPTTQTGANTFGCLIDGKVWIPTGGGIGSGINATRGGFFQDAAGKLNIYIAANSYNDGVEIYLKHITSTGTFYLNSNTGVKPNVIFPESYGVYFIDGQEEYVTDFTHTGTVNISYADTTKGIVAGTFEMQLYQKTSGKVINVTQGKFDYKNH